MLGASFDSKEANAKFRAKYEFPFPLLCDSEQKLAKAYAAEQADKPYPARAAVVIGPDGKIVKWWGKVDAKTFPETVLAELPAVKKG